MYVYSSSVIPFLPASCKMHFLVEAFSLQFFQATHIHMWIHTFLSHQVKYFITVLVRVWLKFFLSALPAKSLLFFVFHLLPSSNKSQLLEIFTSFLSLLHLSYMILLVSCKLFASLSRLAVMNQQVTMNLK